ncbi:MAG TPA: hypothetical protein ENJ62_05930 [Bryobacterales bacterium]|nr:hypothetical protein [Bryobacterales bacterium]
MKFDVGSRVRWKAQGRGRGRWLHGVIVAVVPPGQAPLPYLAERWGVSLHALRVRYNIRFVGAPRDDTSYVVLGDAPGRDGRACLYRPRPNRLEPAS